jgi:hypothetical protein
MPLSTGFVDCEAPMGRSALGISASRPYRNLAVLASVYRTLAYWLSYLALTWVLLAPIEASRALTAAIRDAGTQAQARAAVIAAGLLLSHTVVAPKLRPAVSEAIAVTNEAVARMVVICGVLHRACRPQSISATPAGVDTTAE